MLAVIRPDPEAVSHRCGPAWLVVATQPRAEKDTAAELAMAGFDVYLPLEKRRGRPGRPQVSTPLIPRYVFAGVDLLRQDWGLLRHLDGVVDVIANNGTPSRVPTSVVEKLMKSEAYGGFDYTQAGPGLFSIGETVRVGGGIFTGFNARIAKFVAKMRSTTAVKRARVLLEFMGAMREVDLDVGELEKI
jgi:transcription antitermination factor NusG